MNYVMARDIAQTGTVTNTHWERESNMFEYPDFIQNIINIAAIGISVFGIVVMIVVFQASLAAKEYYERKNREYHTRPISR